MSNLFWPSQKSWILIRFSWFCIREFETPWPTRQFCTYLYILYIFFIFDTTAPFIYIFSQAKIPLIHLKKKFYRLLRNSVHTSTLNSNSNLFFKAQYLICFNSRKYLESTLYVMYYIRPILYDTKVKIRHCEKATKFDKISHLFWHLLSNVKTEIEIS